MKTLLLLIGIIAVGLGVLVFSTNLSNDKSGLIKNMDVPQKIEFTFRDITLVKNGVEITGTLVSPLFSDARGIDDNKELKKIGINENDFNNLWNLISKIDFELYKNPGVENFIPAPTDTLIGEKLKLVVDGNEIINKNYERLLFGRILEPLEEIRNQARIIIEKK